MTSLRRSLVPLLVLIAPAACARGFVEPATAPSPPPAAPATTGLRAGFGRADITPPPGAGLMGYGPEGKASQGWRTRLYARALVLEDGSGERLGLVTLDLGQLSPLLHREVAARVRAATGLGPDRLIVSATHTHAGPGNHFGYPAYDELGTSVGGFDPRMVAFLADRIAAALEAASGSMTAARAAWGTAAVWDLTKNRSVKPFQANPQAWRRRFRAPPGSLASGMVDSTLAVLRVDSRDPGDGAFRPAGAFTVFAIHGTGIPSANRLYDADIQGVAERRLEAHIDSINGRAPAFRPTAVHLVANSAEGDVAPDVPVRTRCQVPWLAAVRRPAGPRTPPGPELWIPPDPPEQARCLVFARSEVLRVGTALGEAVVAVFDSIGRAGTLSDDFVIRRVFQTVGLTAAAQIGDGLCPPQPGTATLAGADDGYTRYRNWRFFGVHDVGFAEDSAVSTRNPPRGCQGSKKPFLGRLQRRVLSRLLPDVAQVTVADVGGSILVAIPFEATTVVGGMIRDAALAGAAVAGSSPDRALVVGLANGYNQYVASPAEYRLQNYEGSSTLYGPRTAEYLARLAGDMAARLPAASEPSPDPVVPELTFFRLGDAHVLPPPHAGPAPEALGPRRLTAAWEGDALVARWTDLHPGRLVPADGPVIAFRYRDDAGSPVVVWDDDPRVEVWQRGPGGHGAWLWEARWTLIGQARPAGPVQVVLAERPGLDPVAVTVR